MSEERGDQIAGPRGDRIAGPRSDRIAGCRRDLRTVFGAVHAAAAPAWLALDLTMAQIRALVTLRVGGSQSVGGLGGALAVSEPTASQLVERLVQRGLVERCEDAADRRRVLVSLTAKADRAFDSLQDDGDRTVDQWLARLGDDELASLTRGLRALALVSGALSGCCAPAVDKNGRTE